MYKVNIKIIIIELICLSSNHNVFSLHCHCHRKSIFNKFDIFQDLKGKKTCSTSKGDEFKGKISSDIKKVFFLYSLKYLGTFIHITKNQRRTFLVYHENELKVLSTLYHCNNTDEHDIQIGFVILDVDMTDQICESCIHFNLCWALYMMFSHVSSIFFNFFLYKFLKQTSKNWYNYLFHLKSILCIT